MSKEIYTERSLWGSFFSPGYRPAVPLPTLAPRHTPHWMRKANVISEPPLCRLVQDCRNLELLQRLLESGRDETIRRLLFLPNLAKTETETHPYLKTIAETQTTLVTSSADTQTTQEPGINNGIQTTTAAVSETACQTTSVSTADTTSQTTPVSMADTTSKTTPVSTADTTSQTTTTADAGQQACPVTSSAKIQTERLQTSSRFQQTDTPRSATVQCHMGASSSSVGSQVTPVNLSADDVAVDKQDAGCQTTDDHLRVSTLGVLPPVRGHVGANMTVATTPVSPYTTPRPGSIVLMSPTPRSLSVSPNGLDVGSSPVPVTFLTGELWTPWTDEEMVQMAEENTLAVSQRKPTSVQYIPPAPSPEVESTFTCTPAFIPDVEPTATCPPALIPAVEPLATCPPAPISDVESTTTCPPAEIAAPLEEWISFSVMASDTPRKLGRVAKFPSGVPILDPGRLEVLLNPQTTLEFVGEGGFGVVFRVRDAMKPAPYPLVCKQMPSVTVTLGCLLNEVRVMARLRQTAVTPRLYGVVKKSPHHADHNLVMEFIPDARELGQMIQDRVQLSARLWLDILVQIVAGVRTIHQAGVIHNDLKYNNVLVAMPTPDAVRVYIIDFGVSSVGSRSYSYDQDTPQRANIAPEVYSGQPTSPGSDVFGIGGMMMQVNKVIRDKRLIPPMLACMQTDPRDRPTTGQLLKNLRDIHKDL